MRPRALGRLAGVPQSSRCCSRSVSLRNLPTAEATHIHHARFASASPPSQFSVDAIFPIPVSIPVATATLLLPPSTIATLLNTMFSLSPGSVSGFKQDVKQRAQHLWGNAFLSFSVTMMSVVEVPARYTPKLNHMSSSATASWEIPPEAGSSEHQGEGICFEDFHGVNGI